MNSESIKCKGCDYDKNAPDGICSLRKAVDGLLIRCVGGWSKAKHYYLKRYIETFTISMRNKWHGQLYYIDLFAGPGKCRLRETGEETDASPLIALSTKYPFAKYFFADLNSGVLEALSERCKSHQYHERIEMIQGDCNIVIDKVINSIPVRSLSLAFIDPTGLHFKFSTLQKNSTTKGRFNYYFSGRHGYKKKY